MIVTDHVPAKLVKTGQGAGIDMGKDNFIATSDNQLVINPRFLKEKLAKLKQAQARQANSNGGTKQKRQAGEKMSRSAIERSKIVGDTHEKISNCRADFHNKLVYDLVHTYDTIYIEDLDIAGMIKGDPQFNIFTKTSENRNTYDAGWNIFMRKLICKAASAGKQVILVDPSYTSQRCNKCTHIDRGNRNHKKFHCLKCGYIAHADINASCNIKDRGEGVTFKHWQPPVNVNLVALNLSPQKA
jgi:putative transposase